MQPLPYPLPLEDGIGLGTGGELGPPDGVRGGEEGLHVGEDGGFIRAAGPEVPASRRG